MKYSKGFMEYFRSEKCFTHDDARRFLMKNGASSAYSSVFVRNMLSSSRMRRIRKGVYTFSGDEAVAGFAFSPFYYGLQYALTVRRLWTQVSSPVVITTTKAVPGVRESMGVRITVRRISKDMFFGFEYVRYSGLFVPVSNLEKTLVDMVYYGIGLGNSEVRELVKKANRARLREYAKRAGIGTKWFGRP